MGKMLVAMAMTAVAAFATAGCATCEEVNLNPVWSPDVPAEDFVWSKTTNVFPFYSKNTTAFVDRVEESGNALLFISWSKVMPRIAPVEIVAPAEIEVEPVGVEPIEEPAPVEAPAA